MARHSKWHNIQARKGKQDKLRSNTFTKLARLITIAAREGGGNPEMNFSLRLAVASAKAVNLSKDTIERAIKRGMGELEGEAALHELVYEGFGQGGVALLVEVVTDNKNRSAGDIKNIFSKYGGTMAGPGSVQWQFEHRGVVRLTPETKSQVKNWEETELKFIDAGVLDILESIDGVEFVAPVENLKKLLTACIAAGIEPDDSGLEWLARELVTLDEEVSGKLARLCEAIEEHDDVRAVYTNEG